MVFIHNFNLKMEAWEKISFFGANMSSSVHVDNKGKDMLILGEGPAQGLDDTALTAEAKNPINLTQSKSNSRIYTIM